MIDKSATTWRKSSCSADNDQCVELLGTLDAIRDSKNPGRELRFSCPGQVPQLIRFLKESP